MVEPKGFEPFIPSTLAYRSLFEKQIGDNRMYEFKDRSNRDLCLIPEVTAVARAEYQENRHLMPNKIWYATRCYRYDNPQRGRYREFWQFGVEQFGDDQIMDLLPLAFQCLQTFGLGPTDYTWKTGVERGLGYYTGQGFEFRSNDGLQLLGAGPYAEGIGFALGIDRCLLVKRERESAGENYEQLDSSK